MMRVASAWLIVFVIWSSTVEAQQRDPRTTIGGTLSRGVDLLEKRDYETFLLEMNRPESLRDLLGNKSIASVIGRQARAGSFDRLLKIMKAAMKVRPRMAPDKMMAFFELEPAVEGQRTFALFFAGGYWYVT
jgi:hypothetical protein